MSDVRINTRSPYYVEANPTEPTQPTIPDPIEENTPPTVTITASNTTPYLGETVTLTAVATDSDGTIVSYEWGGFGVGNTTQSITATNTSLFESQIFSVVVTDDDGDTASAITTINWQEVPEQTTNTDIDVNCGDIINEGSFIGIKTYNLVGVGDKVGDVEIEFLDGVGNQDVPVKFDITWNGNTETTGYIGLSEYDDSLSADAVPAGDINTGEPTTKSTPTTLTINKSTSSPSEVKLTAYPIVNNDSYSFRLNCPDVEATKTFFHTLTGTCTSGDTTFTYTDVKGVTQSVDVANGETELVSAQEDTVVTAVCSGTVEKGGESFDLGNPEQTIDLDTEFVFWLDTSGSLRNEVEQLKNMINNELKSSFLTYYNDDSTLYNDKVIYRERKTENFLNWAQVPRSSSSTKTVISIYIDESGVAYHPNGYDPSNNTKTTGYSFDINDLRNRLDSQTNFGDHLVIVFCIEKTTAPVYWQFSHFIDNVSTGVNGYDGSGGLSDRSEVIFVRNVLPEQDSAYYHKVTINALTDLGYNI